MKIYLVEVELESIGWDANTLQVAVRTQHHADAIRSALDVAERGGFRPTGEADISEVLDKAPVGVTVY